MLKQTKIRYHYDFPNLPINDNDIQALHDKMTDILWTAESCIYELNHQKIHLPKIFISDDIVTKTYGKYDYKAILKEIKKFSETFLTLTSATSSNNWNILSNTLKMEQA